MSFRAKRELLVQVAPRYCAARHGQRSVILDEFVAVTGYDRKYAIRLLLGPIQPPQPIRRARAAQYGVEVQEALANAWTAANGICGKRLVPFLHELIPHTRTAWAPESVRRGPPASAVAQPGDGGSIAEAAAPATLPAQTCPMPSVQQWQREMAANFSDSSRQQVPRANEDKNQHEKH